MFIGQSINLYAYQSLKLTTLRLTVAETAEENRNNFIISRAIIKYGYSNFTLEILE